MKKQSLRDIQKDIWIQCRRLTPDSKTCYTCGREFTRKNKQLGHFINKQMLPMEMKYSLDLLRWQCYQCNVRYGGCGSMFFWNMVNEVGQEAVDEIFARYVSLKGIEHTNKEKREYYNTVLKEYANL